MKRSASKKVLSKDATRMLQDGGTTATRRYANKWPQQPIGKALERGRRVSGASSKGKGGSR